MKNNRKKRINLGVIGCGRVFELYHLPSILASNDFNLISTCDISEPRLTWLKQKLPGIETVADPDIFFENDNLEAILIASSPVSHYENALSSLMHKIPVLVEKPLTLNYTESRNLISTAIQQNINLMTGFNRRYKSPYILLKEKFQNIDNSKFKSMKFTLILNSLNWKPYFHYSNKDSEGWNIFDDVVSHQLDLLTWLFPGQIYRVKTGIRTNSNSGVMLNFKVLLKDGREIDCSAGQCNYYLEKFEIGLDDYKIITYSTGLLTTALPDVITDHLCLIKSNLHFAIHKALKTPNANMKSYINQLSAFAEGIKKRKIDINYLKELETLSSIIEDMKNSHKETVKLNS